MSPASGFDVLRSTLADERGRLTDAEQQAGRARWELARADAALAEALRTGDDAAIGRARDGRSAAEEEQARTVRVASGLRDRVLGGVVDFVDELRRGPESVGDALLAGVDPTLPIALLPVRLETRFSGPADARTLKVRIYPDDVHVDDHEPDLTEEEASLGRAYWTAVRDEGGSEAEAWTVLAGRLGPYRALWVRERLEPTDDGSPPTFPEVALRPPGTSRPTVARALPDVFLVRVRAAGETTYTPGHPVADALQLGPDLSGPRPAPSSATGPEPAVGDLTAVLAEEARWLSDFEAAVAVGMAVEVPLPNGCEYVDDVAVTGVCVSLTADDASALVDDLVTRHRVTHGAGFVAPGTPTNNLADTTSGWLSRPDPSRLDPATLPAAGAASNAAVLARALGLGADRLGGLVGAADNDSAEAEAMTRALFEATWGPYLRTQAQPGFPLPLLPQVHGHVTRWVRGGGPLPALRLGRQPYGILPVQPRTGWAPHDDDTFSGWLAGYLPRIRQLWLAGRGESPSGLAALTHEPVSSRYRVRTTNASSTRPFVTGLGILDGGSGDGIGDRRLVAELGLGEVLPMVVSSIFTPDAVDLWMPVSDEHDLDFRLSAPSPKQATSVLGLLLRNAALQVSTNLADEWLSPAPDVEIAGYAARQTPTFGLTELSGVAVSASPDITLGELSAFEDKLSLTVADEHGAESTVEDRLVALSEERGPALEVGSYLHTEAFRTYRAAHDELARIPVDRRARLTGEVLDCASHRYDAWVTSLATRRLDQLRQARPTGLQLGAWGVVSGVRRRQLAPEVRDDLPTDCVTDPANRGFVLAPSLQHATVAGVLRAAWLAHGAGSDPGAPFAVDLRSRRVRQALALADGMRNGQQLGALLGYQLERALHDASGSDGVELDWAVFELRRRYPLGVTSAENAGLPSERLVVDGWRLAQDAMSDVDGAGARRIAADVMTQRPSGIGDGTDALEQAITGVIGSLDGLTDLGLAEAVHQLAGANHARAAAATDMIGRAAVPPDGFDVATTPRAGRGIDQRLVVAFGGEERPAGYATTRRSELAPQADAFVARRLGPLTGITLRLLAEDGTAQATVDLDTLGLSALDLAADAASQAGAVPFPLLLARARAVTGRSDVTSIGLDPDVDEQLVDLLEHAAHWHRALAGRRPLSQATLHPRAGDLPGDDPSADGVALAAVQAVVEAVVRDTRLEVDDPPPLDPQELAFLGLDAAAADETRRSVLTRRVADARAARDAGAAAQALFGGACVVTGTLPAGTEAPWTADQRPLGVGRGDLVGWVHDTGRVREAGRALDEALLHDELAAATDRVSLRAGQSPAVAGAVDPADPGSAKRARRWVGQAFPADLGRQPVVSFVVAHDGDPAPGAAGREVVGVEVDGWVEVVPERAGAGAVAANLASPDSRAPNTILLAVPADVDAPWTQEALFSVIDEALELAECRLVDLDASRRIPAVLPAIYISEYDDDADSWRDLIHARVDFPQRYVRKGAL